MKGMRAKFQNKRGRPKQTGNGRFVRLMGGVSGSLNGMWRFR